MAIRKFLFQLEWVNDDYFQMLFKEDDLDIITVLRMNENNHLSNVRGQIGEICNSFFSSRLSKALDEMIKQ